MENLIEKTNRILISRERGICSNVGDLENLLTAKFSSTVACLGNPRLRKDIPRIQVSNISEINSPSSWSVQVVQPFPMIVSRSCSRYYRLEHGEMVMQGRGRCSECCQPETTLINTEKRRRGRPRTKPSQQIKKRIISDSAKSRLYEHRKRFREVLKNISSDN